jgi:hypothetical protein
MRLNRRQWAQAVASGGAVWAAASAHAAAPAFGTALRPFSAQSPWNARPLDAVLGGFEIPASEYLPGAIEGTWSTGVFVAQATDSAQRIVGLEDQPGIWDPDAEAHRPELLLPRWPAGVLPASGSDGHADVVDAATGLIHSFFQLKRQGEGWACKQYAWTRLDGRGWGDPAHYFQGARAAGVATMGGLIRRHEVNDGAPHYAHALALSLTFNGLSAKPSFIFPATSADSDAARTNTGGVPQGALLMLPSSFDTDSIASAKLRKIANTLKRHGGYVVDRNHGTPFAIYVENGSNFRLHGALPWNADVARELERIRSALRQVVSASGWLDGLGRPVNLRAPLNLLSMRGAWRHDPIDPRVTSGAFQTWRQAVAIGAGEAGSRLINTSGRNLSALPWAQLQPGQRARLQVQAQGPHRLRLRLLAADGQTAYDSGELAHGASTEFDWPAQVRSTALHVHTGARVGNDWVRAQLLGTAGVAP